jgi:hypothetical protein
VERIAKKEAMQVCIKEDSEWGAENIHSWWFTDTQKGRAGRIFTPTFA